MKGEREAKRRAFLSERHRCWGCTDLLPADDIGIGHGNHYCAKCRAAAESDIWRRPRDGDSIKDIAKAVGRSPSMVHEVIARLERSQDATSSFSRNDGIPRCRCGLRIDKDHLVCDLYGARGFANNRRGGPTYPGNG